MRHAVVAVALVVAWPAGVRADEVDTCVAAADHAQQLRDQGKMLEAREQLLVCGGATCPKPVVKQCVRWLQEVETEMPTLSLRARDKSGADVADVAVLVDGAPRLDTLDGRPLPINPGSHKLTFRRGGIEVEQSIVVRVGEKDRLIDVQLGTAEVAPGPPPPPVTPPPPPPPPPAPAETHRGFRFPWTTALFLGLGAAGFISTGVLVAVAGSDAAALRTTCAPTCSPSDVDAVQTKIVVANVTLGIGIAMTVLSAIPLVIANVGGRHADAQVQLGLTFNHGLGASATATF